MRTRIRIDTRDLVEPQVTVRRRRIFISGSEVRRRLVISGPATPICSYCGNYPVGNYKVFSGGGVICAVCDQRLAKCLLCGLPVSSLPSTSGGQSRRTGFQNWLLQLLPSTSEGQPLCRQCDRRVPSCFSCNRRIFGQYWTYDGGRKFCADCQSSSPQCSLCSEPAGGGSRRYLDGRHACRRCAKDAISSEAIAKEFLSEVASDLDRLLTLKVDHSLNLRLVDASEMARLSGRQWRPSQELEFRLIGLFHRRGERFEIDAEVGLPRPMMYAILAHEFAHAWQSENCPISQGALLKEGFAEYASYLVVGQHNFTEYRRRMEIRRDVYGQGLARVRRLASRMDVVELLDYLKMHA